MRNSPSDMGWVMWEDREASTERTRGKTTMSVPSTTETVTVDVPRWGRYVSDADLFNAQMCRTRAELLREVLDRCVEERGDSSFLRTLRKQHLAGMLADFATGNRRNGWGSDCPCGNSLLPCTLTDTGVHPI